jgi:hypothetical protein
MRYTINKNDSKLESPVKCRFFLYLLGKITVMFYSDDFILKLIKPLVFNNDFFSLLEEEAIKKYTAYHEAGHGYFAVKYKMEIRSITIEKKGNSYGYTDTPYPENMKSEFKNYSTNTKNITWATFCYSGLISGFLFTGILNIRGASNDLDKIEIMCLSEKIRIRIFNKIIKEFQFQTAREKIHLLAMELLRKTTLTGDEIYKLIS